MAKSRGAFVRAVLAASLIVGLGACGDDDGDAGGTIFPEKPECEGASIVPYMGQHPMVISRLNIGEPQDGFDLDGDGMPDNKLAPLSGLAGGPIADAFDGFQIIIPLELFDFPDAAVDSCVKFAFYLGQYQLDRDGDGAKTAGENGDCDDNDPLVHPGATEVADNGKDDDCDGLADEAADGSPSMSTADTDGDGVTIADGDCNDNDTMVGPGGMEICGDGKDNDCKQGGDYTKTGDALACTPFDATGAADEIVLDPLSFSSPGVPAIQFTSGQTAMVDGALRLTGGPSLFEVTLPIGGIIDLDLRITGATLEADVGTVAGDLGLTNGRLGGVLDATTLDTIRGLDVELIGLKPEDSLLDAIFTNPTLGVFVVLEKIDSDGDGAEDCSVPDIDVDRDGKEAFCDSNLDGDPDTHKVDTCIDGDGTVFHDGDEGSTHCTEILNTDGTHRFVDGVSVALTFETVPAILKME